MGGDFYLDEKCIVSASFSELGWFLQYFQARMRFLKQKEYPDYKMLLFLSPHLHVFVNDFVDMTIDLPKWFYDLKLDYDCYEAVPSNSPTGSLTDPIVYARLLNYFRQFYNVDKAIEIWNPRGCNFHYNNVPQIFCKYEVNDSDIKVDKEIIVVFPRARARASNRNVPHYVWYELVNMLRQNFIVVLAGTPSGACLADIEGENIINLINYNEADKTNRVIEYLNLAKCSISSQSGGTHISLLCDCPSYIIGHEGHRHCVELNRLQTPTAFRTVQDYRAIDSQIIVKDVLEFIVQLNEQKTIPDEDVEKILQKDNETLRGIIYDQSAHISDSQ